MQVPKTDGIHTAVIHSAIFLAACQFSANLGRTARFAKLLQHACVNLARLLCEYKRDYGAKKVFFVGCVEIYTKWSCVKKLRVRVLAGGWGWGGGLFCVAQKTFFHNSTFHFLAGNRLIKDDHRLSKKKCNWPLV